MLNRRYIVHLIAFFVVTTFAFCGQAGDGSLIGNGGDLLYCRPQAFSEFEGFYTLDFILDFRTGGPFAELAPIKSWEDSRDRIQKNLDRMSPALATSFRAFTQSVLSSDADRKWVPTDLSAINIHDEEIGKLLPSNCYRDETHLPHLIQTVVRRYGSSQIEYLYDQKNLAHLKAERPIQFSFFIVHEWLWDFTTNARDLRRLNWILHSLASDKMVSSDLEIFLERGGFFNRFVPICHRSESVRTALENATSRSCGTMTKDEVAKISSLKLTSTSGTIRSGDLSGLYGLEVLDLSETQASIKTLPPYAFADLVHLKDLVVAKTDTVDLSDHLKQGPMQLKVQRR